MRWTAASVVTALATASSGILPITGADMRPLVAVASFCLLAGTGALVAGGTGRVPVAAGKRRRHRRSAR